MTATIEKSVAIDGIVDPWGLDDEPADEDAYISSPQAPAVPSSSAPSSPPDFSRRNNPAPIILPRLTPPRPFTSLWDRVINSLCDGIRGDPAEEPTDETSRNLHYRKLCRAGNPFPLIAYQWPSFVIIDPEEAKYFDGDLVDPDSTKVNINPCLRLDRWQRDGLTHFFDNAIREIFIKGCVGAGKGTMTALCLNLAYEVWRDCRIIITSSTYEHAVDTMFAEVALWRTRMAHPGKGKLLAEGIYENRQHQLMVLNPMTGESFSGKHGEKVVFAFDEASSSRQLLYDNALNQFHKIIALSNPRTLFGWFRDGFKGCTEEPAKEQPIERNEKGEVISSPQAHEILRPNPNRTQTVGGPFGLRRCITVGGDDCLNVRERRLEHPIAPPGGITIRDRLFAHNETIPAAFMEDVRPLIPNQSDYGRIMGIRQHPDKREVAVKADGHFPDEDPQKQVILASWLDRHEAAWLDGSRKGDGWLPPVEAFGFDAARSLDGDASVLTAGGLHGMRGFHRWKFNDTTFHVVEILRIANEMYGLNLRDGRTPVTVDSDGLGSGVADQLRKEGVWVIEFHGNAVSAVDPRRYANLRAEAYGTLGRRLDPADQWGTETWAFPPDDDLRLGLTAPEKVYAGDAIRFRISPKNKQPGMSENVLSVKEKLQGRSPDTADATVYLFHGVRMLHGLNAWFSQWSGPLVVSGGMASGENGSMNGNGKTENNGSKNGYSENASSPFPQASTGGHADGTGEMAASGANGHRSNGRNGQNGLQPAFLPSPQAQMSGAVESLTGWLEEQYGGRIPRSAAVRQAGFKRDEIPVAAVTVGGSKARVSVVEDDVSVGSGPDRYSEEAAASVVGIQPDVDDADNWLGI